MAKELNVKQVEFTEQADQYITYTVLPDLKRLGPRLGKQLPLVKNALAKADAGEAAGGDGSGRQALRSILTTARVNRSTATTSKSACKPSQAGPPRKGKACVVVLSTELTPELIAEGLAREMVHAIQSGRKDRGCEYTDRIEVGIVTESAEIRRAVEQVQRLHPWRNAGRLDCPRGPLAGVEPVEIKIGDDTAASCTCDCKEEMICLRTRTSVSLRCDWPC